MDPQIKDLLERFRRFLLLGSEGAISVPEKRELIAKLNRVLGPVNGDEKT